MFEMASNDGVVSNAVEKGFKNAKTIVNNVSVGNISSGEELDSMIEKRCKKIAFGEFFTRLSLFDELVNHPKSRNAVVQSKFSNFSYKLNTEMLSFFQNCAIM